MITVKDRCRICGVTTTEDAIFCEHHGTEFRNSPEAARFATKSNDAQARAAVVDFAQRAFKERLHDKAVKATHCDHLLPLGECPKCTPKDPR